MLFVPELGTLLTLWGPWEFTLYPEHRNRKLGEKLGFYKNNHWVIKGIEGRNSYSAHDWDRENERWVFHDEWNITLPADTILRVDRIYIRKGNKEYSSMSFWIKNGEYKGARFWAKLEECNQIIFNK